MSLNIVKKTGTANTTSCSRTPQYIAIHYTAGTRSTAGIASNVASMFSKTSTKASADFIVDDNTIVQYNPDPTKYYCWAVGGSKVSGSKGGSLYGTAKNANCVSIEMCSTNSTGQITNANDSNWSISNSVVDLTVELTKYLMDLYNIPTNKVIRHYDVTGKYCPGVVGWNANTGSETEWNKFKSRLMGSSAVNTQTENVTVTNTTKNLSNSQFIEQVATLVKKYAPSYGVSVYSPIIAQACLESSYGTSELAVNANNFFGLKYNAQVSENSAYYKTGSEQNADGSYTSSAMQWCSFSSLEKGVEGYFKFLFGRTGITRYNNLKGVTDPETYLNNIKADGYATSLSYVSNNMAVITKWNLTKYDNAAAATQTVTPTQTVTNTTATDSSLAGTYQITASALRMRKTAGTGTVVTTVSKGNKVTANGQYVEVSGVKWLYCTYGSYSGYMTTQYLSKVATQTVTNTTNTTTSYSKAQFIKDVQGAIGVTVDGIVGPKTLAACPTISASKNRSHAVVKYLQKYLNALGYNCGTVDGVAGSKFTAAAKSFQSAKGLTADGIFGQNSWKAILK